MLLLIYFNPIIGPDLLYSTPENYEGVLSEDSVDQIKRLMDAATPGFFTHAFSADLYTANYFFMLPSAWARGKQEMVMITKIIEEESPNLIAYKDEFKKFIKKVKGEYPSAYKALYINNPPLNYEEEIKEIFNDIVKEFRELSKFFNVKEVQTHGILLPISDLKESKSFPIPASIINEMEMFLNEKDKYFIVFQKRKESFKIELIPFNGQKVIKIAVVFKGQLSPQTLKEIGRIFQQSNLPFIFTSGICQKGADCIYEVYLNPREAIDFELLIDKLKAIRNVDNVKLIEIN